GRGLSAGSRGGALPRLQDLPGRRHPGALGPAVDGALARDPRPAGGPRPRRAGVPLARALQGPELAAETTVEACARFTDPRRALHGAEAPQPEARSAAACLSRRG